MLISADRLAVPVEVRAVFDPSGPAWDPLSTFDTSDSPVAVPYPPRILAGTNSHALPASAVSRNGYCLDANIDGVTPIVSFAIPPSAFGFRTFATDPIDPTSPPIVEVPLPSTGAYVWGPYGPVAGAGAATTFDGVTPAASDVYCAVAYGQPGYKNLTIEWHYDFAGAEQVIAIEDIPIVTVTLGKIGDGLVGGPAEVCTTGWDSGFLTGSTSNAGGLAGVEPDPVNDVRTADFVPTGTFIGFVSVAYVRQVGTEWCAGIASTDGENDIQVTFNFDAVYNRVDIGSRDQDVDDQSVSIALPGTALIDIRDVVELRHVTIDGQVPPRQRSGPLVIGMTHYVCLIGTNGFDSLAGNQITFNPLSPPDAPGNGGVSVFHKTPAHQPRLSSTIADGTICFSYYSGAPGEHAIFVTFSNAPANGAGVSIPQQAFFDSDSDGNGVGSTGSAGPLIAEWNRIDETVISSGGSPDRDQVTYTQITVPLSFNLADGTYLGNATLSEWVLGSHTTAGKSKDGQLLNGVLIRAEIIGGCGYFVVPDSASPTFAKPTVVFGISVGGRFELNNGDANPFSPAYGDTDASPDDFQFSTLNSGGCSPGVPVRVQIDIYYPLAPNTPALPHEWVDMGFSFLPAMKTPRVAWAGQFVTITYAVSSNETCEGMPVHFVRPKGQPGSFMAGPGIELRGPDHAVGDFGTSCSTSVVYESEDQGEVDVEVFIENNPYSKVAFPIFYLLFEDVLLESTPDQFVSTFGDVTANVRGYFVGTNPSGRPQETKPDGRTVPADRWILPDDWERLKGESNLRTPWGSVTMPMSIVTFFMENEGVINNYKAKVKHGASGFLIPDTEDDFSFNVNPHTKATTILGTLSRPRMMSSLSDDQGEASVDTFGDRNLSYEGCAPNAITGNPHCKPEEVAGKTRYYAVAEYPQAGNRGKYPAVASNVDETVWRWAGYKDVTIVNTDSPQIKYVVAHLRDRDGFCDAANYNNTLGVPVTFEIDAGDGVIIEAADRPYAINGTRRFATTTTFDTRDLLGNPINTHIARPPLIADQPDECQAWIKVTNSVLTLTNVTVTFPAPPSPIPGDIRITNLQCTGAEAITVKNFGDKLVNLGGFALKSSGSDVGNAEELDMIGLLEPGESKTFPGGPGAAVEGWLGAENEVLEGASDYMSVVWEDYPISTVWCDGTRLDLSPLVSFPLDGEGELKMDIVIPFGNEVEVPLAAGWNMVPTGKGSVSIATAFSAFEDKVTAIYVWDATLETWSHYIPGAPAGVNTIDTIGNGVFMWVLVKQPFTLTLPK
ncbi:MAG: hypothetical protein IPH65_03335 [Dehalococcoidia bacterium]|uniref:hypothetical protein n=1 Tax=Candidatus Amarobacter glycogenicus TaxID=3140699 RepID=UPI00313702FE|nr:hypothetical protein [Dehalococcoidia bacterium]